MEDFTLEGWITQKEDDDTEFGELTMVREMLSADEWHHVAFVHSGRTTLWLDGIPQSPWWRKLYYTIKHKIRDWIIDMKWRYITSRKYADDEVLRISKTERWVKNFTPPTEPYFGAIHRDSCPSGFDGIDASTTFTDKPEEE